MEHVRECLAKLDSLSWKLTALARAHTIPELESCADILFDAVEMLCSSLSLEPTLLAAPPTTSGQASLPIETRNREDDHHLREQRPLRGQAPLASQDQDRLRRQNLFRAALKGAKASLIKKAPRPRGRFRGKVRKRWGRN